MRRSRRAVRAIRPRCGWKRLRETIPADYRRQVGTPLAPVSLTLAAAAHSAESDLPRGCTRRSLPRKYTLIGAPTVREGLPHTWIPLPYGRGSDQSVFSRKAPPCASGRSSDLAG